MTYWSQSKHNIFVAAHRGWKDQYPENTMAAFRAALELGVDQLETDVRITKDRHLVLFHDATLERTTNGTGRVCDYTLAELKALDAGDGEQIPTFLELLELVKDHPTLTLDIELKEYPTEGWEEAAYFTCDTAIALLEEYGYGQRCVINSFHQKLNEYVYIKYNGKYRQHLFYPPRVLKQEGSELPLYSFGYCACVMGDEPPEEVAAFEKKTGIRIWAPTSARDEEGIEKAIAMGAELITCNNPDEVLAILRRKGLHK